MCLKSEGDKQRRATNRELANADSLWRLADAVRAQVDAAESNHFVLVHLLSKCIFDSFGPRRAKVRQEASSCLMSIKSSRCTD